MATPWRNLLRELALLLALVPGTVLLSGAALADDTSATMIDNLKRLRFDQLGHPQIQSDSIKPVLASRSRPHKLLILPVRFPDIGYDRFADDPEQDNKNRDYFQQLLFAGGAIEPKPGTLSHYYWHQSRGLYNVEGDIVPVVELNNPLHYYGRPVQTSDGSWRNDERPAELVVDALRAAYAADPDFPWQDYDIWDPEDFDGDGNRDEPDGYLDHFVLIVAGKGQSSCHGLYKLDEKLNANAPATAFDSLNPAEQDCSDRIWPHRFSLSQNLGKGPEVNQQINARGGVGIGNGMWVLDYNMQSEYTEVATFIHEFGHSLGLPDLYARQTNNSTASWDAMSSTASPRPQELSSWSRMVLGWLKPCVIEPGRDDDLLLKTMNDWSGTSVKADSDLCDAAMVILPPKIRDIELGPLGKTQGRLAAYSGQGNDMNRSLSRHFDFTAVPENTALTLSLDAWFEIEAEWDYLYIEAAEPGGEFVRLLPADKRALDDKNSVMPAAKGHEGAGSRPGFTGLSGDTSGDGKVQDAPGCDPEAQRTLAEDRIGSEAKDPCENAQWISANFDLEGYRGKHLTLRFTYFTDMAAVENGALIDNISVEAVNFSDDFESGSLNNWESNGFTLSGGTHHLAVPHFYLLEHRDPYARFASVENYDTSLSHPGFSFFPGTNGEMTAFNVNYRSGVLAWYYNGEYLWSQNEPAESGPGRGFLLVVDSTPQEFLTPALPAQFFRQEDDWTWWEADDTAQAALLEGFVATMCFQRRPPYYPADVSESDRERCRSELIDGKPPMEALSWNNRPLMFGYNIINEFLPGQDRRAKKGGSSLYDLRIRNGKVQYRLYDRLLRNLHSADAPFSLQTFPHGVEYYRGIDGTMQRVSSQAFVPVSKFTDAPPNRYLSPKLPFGGADIPASGLSFELQPIPETAPAGAKAHINFRWKK